MCVISLGCLDVLTLRGIFKKRVCVFLVRINGCLDVLNIAAGTKYSGNLGVCYFTRMFGCFDTKRHFQKTGVCFFGPD